MNYTKSETMYLASVYNVMLASPSDVVEEREIARNIIWEWNYLHSEDKGIVILPTGWETHSSPLMGDRAQGIINKQVLNNSDLLIGIFWTRIGTHTGNAVSGSVEEIDEHINSGKPAMLYFSNKPVVPGSIDQKQYKILQTVKKQYLKKGLIENFSSPQEFRLKFQSQLALTINRDDFFIKNSNQVSVTPLEFKLSDEAKKLLIEASKADGSFTVVRIAEGTHIGVDFQTMNEPNSRSVALWEEAVEELTTNKLVNNLGGKGQIFELTNRGFKMADQLNNLL